MWKSWWKRECVYGGVFPLTINGDRHFSNSTDSSRILSNYRCAQSVASILEDLPPFPNPRTDSRLKLGSFFQRDKSYCGFLASVATRSRGNFPVSIVHFFDLLSNVCVDIFNLEKYIYLSPSVSRVAGKGNV